MKMEKLISICFHPVFIPLLVCHLTLLCLPEFMLVLHPNIKLIYWIIITSSIFLPLLSIYVYIKTSQQGSLEMIAKEERVIPLLYSSFCILIGFLFLKNLLAAAPVLLAIILGAGVISFLSSIISVFWKISLHMMALGAALGSFIALELFYDRFENIIVGTIFISGVVGSARLKSNAHNKMQIYIGFLLGLLTLLFIILNYSHIISIISIFLSSIASIP